MTYRFGHYTFINTALSEKGIRDPEAGFAGITSTFIVPR